jgi:putative hydrolase
MDPDDPSSGMDDPMEALRRLLRDLGLPQDADVNNAEVRADLFRTMMRRLMPTDGMSNEDMVWETARQTARHVVASLGPDPTGNGRTARQVGDAVHLAELWLSEATVLPPSPTTAVVWSRAEWIEATLGNWKAMIEPVIGILAQAVNDATQRRMDFEAESELINLQSILHPIMSRAIAAMFGAHIGEGLGRAATCTMTGTDLGLPLLGRGEVGVLPTNLSAVQQQGELDEAGLLLYCCLAEVARQRLFAHIGWIAPQIIALVQHYARELRVDPEAIASAMENAVPDHLSAESVVAFQSEFSTILFTPEPSAEQRQILDRLSTLLALVEGWVGDVTATVAAHWLPDWAAIAESLRRHRVTSHPTSATITPLIGLSTSPRQIREANQFWSAVRLQAGIEARDEIWRHPEAMPTPGEIANPTGFLAKPDLTSDAWDDELRRFIDSPGPADEG